jgi:hypothetical protein
MELDRVIGLVKPVCVLVYDDTYSTLAGAITGTKAKIPLALAEAGLGSYIIVEYNRRKRRIMTRFLSEKTRGTQTSVKFLVCLWMFLTVFLYLLLFGPPEFWSICQRLGIGQIFQQWQAWLQPYFTADYLA